MEWAGEAMDASRAAESFRGLVLRNRGRTGLTQRQLAARLGAGRRTVQDWETGAAYPSADLLRALIRELLESGGLTSGQEEADARELWDAALREAPRMHTPLDEEWLVNLLTQAAPPEAAQEVPQAVPAAPPGPSPIERDWGEAPAALDFVGRAAELTTLRGWLLEEHSRLVVVLGMGGVGKTALAARLAQDVAPAFQRLYWRSLRDALPTSEWLSGAIGFLSDQRVVPPRAKSGGSPYCFSCCESDPTCWCSTTLRRCLSQASVRDATATAMPVTAGCCRPSARGGIRAAWC
jgi:transcriptional regulator with XRE-family HTH domain